MAKKKKIIIVGTAYPLRGGIASFNERLAQGLLARGHEVEMLTFTLQYPEFLFPGKTQYVENEPAPEGLKITECINSVNPLNWLKVGNQIRAKKPDIVICPFWLPFMGPCLGTILKIVKRDPKVNIISVMHNIVPHEKRIGDQQFAQYFVNQVHGFVSLSKSVKVDLGDFVEDQPIVFSPHPVYDNYGNAVSKEEASEVLELPEDESYLLFFGFIRDYKGLDLLYQAMSDDRIAKLGLKLIVAGEYYGNKDSYDELVRVLDIGDRLILRTDFIPNEKVKYYFSLADLVVQPYKTATQSGISQLAYHFEKPMVVTRVGGLPEIVPHGEAGYVVDVEPKAIADAIVDFFKLKNPNKFASKLKANKAFYSWDHFVDEVLQLESDLNA